MAQLSAALSLCRQGAEPSLPGQVSGRAGAIAQPAAADLCRARAPPLAEDAAWTAFRQHLYATPWVVYAKPPWGSPEQVLKYLSRYTHRVAIANSRLVFVGDGIVRFRYKDYAAEGTPKVMELRAEEFLRRFLLHVVPPGFVRIRHYGLLANRTRQEKLTRCPPALGGRGRHGHSPPGAHAAPPTDTSAPPAASTRCPHCAGSSLADHRPPGAPARTPAMTRLHAVPTLPLWHSSLLVTSLTERSGPVRSHPGSSFFSRAIRADTPAPAPSLAPVRLLLRLVAARFTARATIGRSPQTR